MRKFVPYAFAALAAIIVVMPAVAADNPQKPGKWQIQMQTEMPGLPFKMPPIKTEVCLTAEDLADPQKSVPTDAKSSCKVGDYKINGQTVTWTVDCPKEKMKGTGEITYTDTSYTGTMKMTLDEQEITTKYTGKFLGECKK